MATGRLSSNQRSNSKALAGEINRFRSSPWRSRPRSAIGGAIQVHAASACSPENVRHDLPRRHPRGRRPQGHPRRALHDDRRGRREEGARQERQEGANTHEFSRTYLDPHPSTAARVARGGRERARRARRRSVAVVEARIGRRSRRRAGHSARRVAAKGGVFRIKLRALPSLSEPTGRKNRLPPLRKRAPFFFRENQNDKSPTDRRSLLFSDRVHRARRSPSASGSSTPRAVTPARSALATRVSSRTAASRARRSKRARL